MARKKTTEELGYSPILEPLLKHKAIKSYILTEDTSGNHNKFYFFFVVKVGKNLYTMRVWGRRSFGEAAITIEDFDQTALQKLIDEKGKKGYKIINDADIDAEPDLYAHLVAETIRLLDEALI